MIIKSNTTSCTLKLQDGMHIFLSQPKQSFVPTHFLRFSSNSNFFMSFIKSHVCSSLFHTKALVIFKIHMWSQEKVFRKNSFEGELLPLKVGLKYNPYIYILAYNFSGNPELTKHTLMFRLYSETKGYHLKHFNEKIFFVS